MAEPAPPGGHELPDFSTLPALKPGGTLLAEGWIAWDHLRPKWSSILTNVTTLVSIIAVVLGVAVLNCVIAVMAGFEIDLRDKILGSNAHIVVMRHGGMLVDADRICDEIEAVPGVVHAAPFVYQEMMIRSTLGHTGVIMKGVDPERTPDVTHLRDDLTFAYDGELKTPDERAAAFARIGEKLPPLNPELEMDDLELPGIFIGKDLKEALQVRPGDKVQLINPVGTGTSMFGMPTPTVKSFRIAGIFDSGMFEYNNKWTYVNNEDAQSFLKIGSAVNGIEVKVDDIYGADRIATEIEEKIGYPHYTKDWQELNDKLFDALRLEKWVMGLLLWMIIAVAGMLIISTLIMVVLTKIREIAILKAMGASGTSILRVFVMEGSFIGFVGVVFGTAVGLFGCWALW
ncbi:MAG: ABC transporter permease, partial [Phycisphaerales bacterium]|nr:ABC transporter permease [Phycisphaerales bacterium]